MSARRGLVLAAAAPLLFMGALLGVALVPEDPPDACGGTGPAVDVVTGALPAGVAGFAGEQLQNAATIMRAAKDAGLPLRAQQIGVAAAIGESTLRNIGHGDLVGPDSTGLFQQRTPWGSRAERMEPYTSATFFFTGGSAAPDGWVEPGLEDIAGWETLQPTLAINKVQRNADPYHYERFWEKAVAIVSALSGAVDTSTVVPVGQVTGGQSCTGGSAAVPVGPGGWTRPTTGPLTSGFGPRWNTQHNGIDLAPPCGTPIHAAAGGPDGGPATVIRAGRSTGYGNLIVLDHGGGILTRYAHSFDDGVLVRVGDRVAAGQQIAEVGTFGDSTGCHLHFEVQVNGQFTDPEPFLRQRDVALAG